MIFIIILFYINIISLSINQIEYKKYKITKISKQSIHIKTSNSEEINTERYAFLIPKNKMILEKYSYLNEFKTPIGRIKLIYPLLYEAFNLIELEKITNLPLICNCIPLLIKKEEGNCKCLGPKLFTMPYNIKQSNLIYSQSNISNEVICSPSYSIYQLRINIIDGLGCASNLNIVGPSNSKRVLINSKYEEKISKEELIFNNKEEDILSLFIFYLNNFRSKINLNKKLLKKIKLIIKEIKLEIET